MPDVRRALRTPCARVRGCPTRADACLRLRRPVRRFAAAGAAVWLAGGVQAWADTLKIVPLVRDGQVLVSCHLADGYTADVRDVIQSGLRTTFTYTVELRLKVPVWVDRIVESAVVTTTVQYDNLTRRHSVSRLLDGRVEDAKVTEDEAVVRDWLTAFDKLPLFRTSRPRAQPRVLRRGPRRGAARQRRAVLALGHHACRARPSSPSSLSRAASAACVSRLATREAGPRARTPGRSVLVPRRQGRAPRRPGYLVE